MADDWRLTVELAEEGNAPGLMSALSELELEIALGSANGSSSARTRGTSSSTRTRRNGRAR
jgi:hypothetical protein